MAIKSRDELRGQFSFSGGPEGEDYNDLIGSFPNKNDDRIAESVASISGLLNIDTSELPDNAWVHVHDFYSDTQGGGDPFKWDVTGDKADHNGITVIDPTHSTTPGQPGWWTSENTGTTGVFKRRERGFINVEDVGVSTGKSDNGPALTAAIDFAQFPNGRTLVVPPKTYNITSTVTVNDAFALKIQGSVKKYSSTFFANAAMTSMIEFTGTINNLVIDGVEFDGNNNVDRILDTADSGFDSGISYSTIKNSSIRGIKSGGYGLDGVGFVVKFIDCEFWGFGTDPANLGEWEGTAVRIEGASNEVTFRDCNIARLKDGIEIDDLARTLNIEDNTFDNVSRNPIIALKGSKQLNIDGNYFESCGGDDRTLSVYVGTDATLSANIILHQDSGDFKFFPRKNVIKDNHFVNPGKGNAIDGIIALNAAVNTTIEDNSVEMNSANLPTSANSFVYAYGHGLSFQSRMAEGYTLKVDKNHLQSYNSSNNEVQSVSQIFDWNALEDISYGLQGIVIKDSFTKEIPDRDINIINENLLSVNTGLADVSLNAKYDEKYFEYKFTGNGGVPNEISLVDNIADYQGKYLRVTWETKFDTAGNPLTVRLVDGNGDLLNDVHPSSTGTWEKFDVLVRVSDTATRLGLIFRELGDTNVAYLRYFQITLASTDLGLYEAHPQDIYLSAAPTTGTWETNDRVYNVSPSASGNIGWVCVSAGSPGTWKSYGTISA